MLGEMFQDKWHKEMGQGTSHEVRAMKNLQSQRIRQILKFYVQALDSATGLPSAVIKAQKPNSHKMWEDN
jgi:hypothetical protein